MVESQERSAIAPETSPPTTGRGRGRWLALAVANLALGVALLGGIARCGSIGNALRFLRGERIMADPGHGTLTFTGKERSQVVSLVLRNAGFSPVRILGCHVYCNSMVLTPPPYSIPAGGSHTVRILVRDSPKEEAYNEVIPVRFYSTVAHQRAFDWELRIVKDPAKPDEQASDRPPSTGNIRLASQPDVEAH